MAEPTAQEQFMLELVNRARLDPEGEAVRFGIDLNEELPGDVITSDPKQPLAFNPALLASAEGHSAWMLENNEFTDIGEGGSTGEERMAAAGYAPLDEFESGENISRRGNVSPIDPTEMILQHHEGFMLGPQERLLLLLPQFEEIGIGQELGPYLLDGQTFNASLLTQDLAARDTAGPFLTGVVFEDTDGDDFYSVGEGLGDLTIEAVRQTDGMVFSTQTMESGGYQMELPAGTFAVGVTGGSLSFRDELVTIGQENVKLDPAPFMANMFGILVDGVPALTLAGGTEGRFVDATGAQILQVEPSASLELQATSGANVYVLPGEAGDYLVSRDFGDVTFSGPNGEMLAFAARSTAQTVAFDDGAVDVRIVGNGVLAGDQAVNETPAGLASALDPVPSLPTLPTSPPATPNFFGIVVEDTPAQQIDSGTFARIIDATGAQTFHVNAGAALELQASSGANRFTLQGDAADFAISRDVASVTLAGPDGEMLMVSARTVAQRLVFSDGALDLRIEGSSVLAGDQAVTETPAPITASLESGDTSIGIFALPDGTSDDMFIG